MKQTTIKYYAKWAFAAFAIGSVAGLVNNSIKQNENNAREIRAMKQEENAKNERREAIEKTKTRMEKWKADNEGTTNAQSSASNSIHNIDNSVQSNQSNAGSIDVSSAFDNSSVAADDSISTSVHSAAQSVANDLPNYVRAGLLARGWNPSDVEYMINVVIPRESNWNPSIYNTAGSGAYGLFQLMPMHGASGSGVDVQMDVATRLYKQVGLSPWNL